MHCGPKVIDIETIAGIEQKHTRASSNSRLAEIGAWIERQLGVVNRGFAGPDGEAKGSCGAWTVEQRMHDKRIGVRRRLLDPEIRKSGKFLALRVSRAN